MRSYQRAADYGISILLLVAVSFVPSSLITYIVTERITREKQVQMVAGVSPLTYWSVAFAYDTLVSAEESGFLA